MIIERDGIKIKLTENELWKAYKEYKMESTIEDVRETIIQNPEAAQDFTDDEIKDIAETALNGLANDDSYCESYWESINCAIKYERQ